MSIPATRRCLLGMTVGAAGAVAVGGSASASPDASLISDCDELVRLLKTANASDQDMSAAELDQWEVLGQRIITAPTHTTDGLLARIRALAAAHGDFGASFDEPDDEPARMLVAIMRAVDPAGVAQGDAA